MKLSPIADQVRQLRERRFETRVRAMMTPRSAPSPAKVKEIVDRAEARSSTVEHRPLTPVVECSNHSAPAKPQRKFAESVIATKLVGTEKEIKMSPALAAKAKTWDKTLFQKLYLRKRRATTDEARETAEAALREAFPNKRPRLKVYKSEQSPAAIKVNDGSAKKAAPRKAKPARKAKKAKKKGRK